MQSGSKRLRLLRTHPGASLAGQLRILINPTRETLATCWQVVLNLGGPCGTYEVHAPRGLQCTGDFLSRSISGELGTVLDEILRAVGWSRPVVMPRSLPSVLAIRSVADVLAAGWLDRNAYDIETGWFDASSGCHVMPWIAAFGLDPTALQKALDTGSRTWDSIAWDVSGYLRIHMRDSVSATDTGLLFDLDTGTVRWAGNASAAEIVDIETVYRHHGRTLEPLVGQLMLALRRGRGLTIS